MDGFDPRVGIVVIAATNRAEILDQALLRPGRLDRQVAVSPPDRDGREKILRVHSRGLPVADDVDLRLLASQTPGMVGADLANLANEAALVAARRGRNQVHMRDFTDALERIMLGGERHILLSFEERRRIAYHEAGHALTGMLIPGADPVRKVSIIPRGQALGVTLAVPDADQFNLPKGYLMARLRVAVAGRVAEELVFDEVTTGAESDIQQLTQIARRMVGRWGMSERIGLIAVVRGEAEGRLLTGGYRRPPPSARWTRKCGAWWTRHTQRSLTYSPSTKINLMPWPVHCSSTRRWTPMPRMRRRG
jgi:cell division protease FtsH